VEGASLLRNVPLLFKVSKYRPELLAVSCKDLTRLLYFVSTLLTTCLAGHLKSMMIRIYMLLKKLNEIIRRVAKHLARSLP